MPFPHTTHENPYETTSRKLYTTTSRQQEILPNQNPQNTSNQENLQTHKHKQASTSMKQITRWVKTPTFTSVMAMEV